MNEEGPPIDSRFDGGEPFPVSPDAAGISLDTALRDFGPAAIDDLIPRIRVLARRLDAAHDQGHVHGALAPPFVIITDESTSLIAGRDAAAPYAAPEVLSGGEATPESDQFSLAAVTYEWLFDKRISGPADRLIEVRSMPGVERGMLARSFSRALSREPAQRFPSCAAFCDALAAAVVPELPLLAAAEEPDADEPVRQPFRPESPSVDDLGSTPPAADVPPIDAEDLREEPPTALLASGAGPAPEIDPEPDIPLAPPVPVAAATSAPVREVAPVPFWNPPSAPPTRREPEGVRFGAVALIAATLVGAVFGFAAGYMARPRALQSGPPAQITVHEPPSSGSAGAGTPVGAPTAAAIPESAPLAATNPAPRAAASGAEAPRPKAPESRGRLLVRSTPPGATVTVDGVARGETPVALRDLDYGTRTVVIARRGYQSETHRIAITDGRPSRSLDVRLSPDAQAKTPRPAPPATRGRAGAATGGLMVESRPSGAAVSINGRDRGKTPLTVSELAPGDYQVVIAMPGYRNFATTVRVVAGERARAAASLTAVEQE